MGCPLVVAPGPWAPAAALDQLTSCPMEAQGKGKRSEGMAEYYDLVSGYCGHPSPPKNSLPVSRSLEGNFLLH